MMGGGYQRVSSTFYLHTEHKSEFDGRWINPMSHRYRAPSVDSLVMREKLSYRITTSERVSPQSHLLFFLTSSSSCTNTGSSYCLWHYVKFTWGLVPSPIIQLGWRRQRTLPGHNEAPAHALILSVFTCRRSLRHTVFYILILNFIFSFFWSQWRFMV